MFSIPQRRVLFAIATLAAFVVARNPAAADCGSVPYHSPLQDVLEKVVVDTRQNPEVEMDPLKVTVFEPKQRALIAWNGTEELLLLSTDQRVNTPRYQVLEVIPFPAEPKVKLGSFDTFEKAQRLVVSKRTWAMAHGGAAAADVKLPDSAGRIAFEQRMGAHDLAVAECRDPERFSVFVSDYLKTKYGVEKVAIRPEFLAIIKGYAETGYPWFAFDRIDLTDKNQSRQPIEYRFASDHAFYPLRISQLEGGVTDVELLLFTANAPGEFLGLPSRAIRREAPLEASRLEFGGLDSGWAEFFPDGPVLSLSQWSLHGSTSDFKQDVVVK